MLTTSQKVDECGPLHAGARGWDGGIGSEDDSDDDEMMLCGLMMLTLRKACYPESVVGIGATNPATGLQRAKGLSGDMVGRGRLKPMFARTESDVVRLGL